MRTEFQTLVRTGKIHQLLAADLALTEAGIPHNLQEECVSGVRTAMPVDPSPAPGTWWAILVPEEFVEDAQCVLRQLPFVFTTKPDLWDGEPLPRGKMIITVAIWGAIAATIFLLVSALIRA